MLKKRGRPPAFNREDALIKAMTLFWAKGYEGTQLIDLTKSMGINPPSFYAAFGSKIALFYETIDLYIKIVGTKTVQSLTNERTVREGIKIMLESSIKNATSTKAGGCMMVLGIVNNHSENYDAWKYLRAERVKMRELIQARIQRGIDEGELAPDTNPVGLAAHFLGVTQAISFQARDGATSAELMCLIEPALAALAR